MMACEKYKKLIEQYIEGTIGDEKLAELKTHTETCESCREEFERCVLLQDILRRALSSPMAARQAGSSVIAKLSAKPRQHSRRESALFAGRRASVAAGILLAVGLLLGFGIGRAGKSSQLPLTAQVPINVGKINGTVLIRHYGSNVWQTLDAGSKIHLGDTFHSTAGSAFVLQLDDKSTLELNQNSMLVLKLYNGETQFFLEHGECTASLQSPHGPFFISTPNGRVEAIGTEFTVKVTDE